MTTNASGPGRSAGLAFLAFAGIAWGGMLPLGKVLFHHLDPVVMTALRYGFAALLFLGALVWREGRAALRLQGRGARLWLLGTVGFAGFNLLGFEGLQRTQPEQAAVMVALMPLVTALVQWAGYAQRPARATWAAIGLALLGVLLVLSGGSATRLLRGGDVHGDLLVLAGALCWVSYTLGARAFPGWSPLRYTALSCGFGASSIVLIAVAGMASGHLPVPDAADLRASAWGLAYLVLIAAFVAVLGWNAGIARVGATAGVLFINLVPVTAFAIGACMGRHFGGAELIGAALVMSALVINSVFAALGARSARRARQHQALTACPAR
ncbi:EamA-like transporter family protein [mine drainage metagenome]|jgi:drug/metabolite transporter (DMT)-like permease|uniref:EamA-like transporter family protein n=1 Tax=mine drainage metagenome TaxID=410659 RepID=A0A1J5R288_9ZZZZ